MRSETDYTQEKSISNNKNHQFPLSAAILSQNGGTVRRKRYSQIEKVKKNAVLISYKENSATKAGILGPKTPFFAFFIHF